MYLNDSSSKPIAARSNWQTVFSERRGSPDCIAHQPCFSLCTGTVWEGCGFLSRFAEKRQRVHEPHDHFDGRKHSFGPVMRVSIDEALKRKCPRTALGCVTAQVEAASAPPELLADMHARVDEMLKLPNPRGVLESPGITATRAAYKALGKDPARYRGSAEALLRRVLAGKGLPQINAVVDVINLVSVESRLSIGLYDLAHISGDIIFRAGRAGETYKGIGKYDLNLEGLPVFCDQQGPHGSPTSDSERTMVTAHTRHIIAAIISFGGKDALEQWTERLTDLFQRYGAGNSLQQEIIT